MKLLGESTRITNPHLLSFSLKESSWYLVSISARVRSKNQRGEKAINDEDLRIEIDKRKFPKLEDPQRYFDSPAAFSGAKLKNNLKTVFFIIYLKASKHSLSLIPDEEALVENVEVTPLTDFPNVFLELSYQAEKANGRPWMTFVLVNLGLKSFTTKATVNWRFPDGDDIKIIVDEKIKKNKLSILHRNWIFTSNILKNFFGQETAEKKFEENLHQEDFHYIEFWSDESPVIHYVRFEFNSPEAKSEIQIYRPASQEEDYNRFDGEIKNAVNDWNDFFLQQKYPPLEPLDPNLVKAIIYVESRMGFGTSPTGHPSYPDVMQIADKRNPAIRTLNNDGWIDSKTGGIAREYEWINDKEEVLDYGGRANGNTPRESIYWGVRWLYHKAQGILKEGGRYWKSWKEAVANYNKKDNWEYQQKVYKIYREEIDPQGIKLWSIIFFLLISFGLLASVFIYNYQGKFFAYRKAVKGTRDYEFYIATLDGLRFKRFLFSRFYANGADLSAFYKDHFKIYPLELTLKVANMNNRFIAVYGNNISGSETVAIITFEKRNFSIIPKLDKYGWGENTFNGDEVIIKNLDNDPEEEIIEKTLIRYKNADDQIWRSYYDLDAKSRFYKFERQEKTSVSQSL